MKKIIKIVSLPYWVFLLLFGCQMANNIVYMNLSQLYDAENKPEITGLRIFHENDSISTVYIKYELSDFEYQQFQGVSGRMANYSLGFALYSSFESNQILDSATYFLSDSLNYGMNTELFFDFNVKARYPNNYLLNVRVTDLNNGRSTLKPKILEKSSKSCSQCFLPYDQNNAIVFDDWVDVSTNLHLAYNSDSIRQIYVGYYNHDFSVARPPFATSGSQTLDFDADGVFEVKLDNKKTTEILLPNQGIYHFRSDTSSWDGLSLFRFYEGFPEILETDQLIPPLRYLTTNKEFFELMASPDPKMAADSFWISSAGNEERALQILKSYYERVEQANRFFTSFKEGWKTDRGMIYIIFGAPKSVYRRGEIETWTYIEQGNRVAMTFDFKNTINPFTKNDFELKRRADYKTPWFVAVDYWRR